MLNFSPSEEQEEVRRLASSLSIDLLRPQARAAEKQGDISQDVMRTIAQTGLTLPFAEEYGGAGPIEAATYVLVAEELGYGDGGQALSILGSLMGPLCVDLAGNVSQKEAYLPDFGDAQRGYLERGCLGIAEPTGGYGLRNVQTILKRQGNHYLLSGTKRDVLHGEQARLRVILARIEGSIDYDGLCALLLPEQAMGLEVRPEKQKLGMQAAPSATFRLENVVLPEGALLGEPGSPAILRAASLYQLLRAGVACGMTRAALEYASRYAEERIAFGRPIVSYQGIAFMLAEMAMKLDAARLFLWQAAAQWDEGQDIAAIVRDAEAVQKQAIKLAQSATIDAVQVMGGAGFLQDHPVEMWMRNAASME